MKNGNRSVQTIFAEALEQPTPSERNRYLDATCANSPEIRAEVESLLRAFAAAGDFLETAACTTVTFDYETLPAAPVRSVGAYVLLEKLGEGGMGVVYKAQQRDPIQRLVALKIVKLNLESQFARDRFELERQAMAMMDHPCIAKVHDAGVTPPFETAMGSIAGFPYFVMELVDGVPITTYCDREKLDIHARLRLFMAVLHAVQHAHQKGIIHRDLKPTNVLVTKVDGQPMPKIIDFGVAKAITPSPMIGGGATMRGAVLGTPEYMSPEQTESSCADIDTRTDIYSLGILLFALLTGRTPLDRSQWDSLGSSEFFRRVREDDVPSLSQQLKSNPQAEKIAARRGLKPTSLLRLLNGELNWIVMKALEKDRDRRYATAHDFALDVARYLNHQPLVAAPPSKLYRLRKFARRHRTVLATASAIAAVLVLGTVFSVYQAWRATSEEWHAKNSEADAKAVLKFFRDKVIAAHRPEGKPGGLGRDVTLGQALDAAEPTIAPDFANRPLVEAAIRDTLGASYLYLGLPARAVPQLDRAFALRKKHLGPHDSDTLITMNNLAAAYQAAGRPDLAIPLHEQDFAISRRMFGESHGDTLKSMSNLASAYRLAGRNQEALELSERLVKLRKSGLGDQHPDTLISMNNLALAYQAAGRHNEALALHEQVFHSSIAQLGAEHADTLTAANNLGGDYIDAGRIDEALPLLQETLELWKRTLGRENPDTLTTLNNMASALLLTGRKEEALRHFETTYDLRKANLGVSHIDTLQSRSNLATTLREVGRTTEAVRLFEELLVMCKVALPPDHPLTLDTMNPLAETYLVLERWRDAEILLRGCHDRRVQTQPNAWRRFHTLSLLGSALAGQKCYAEAETYLIEGYEGLAARAEQMPPRRRNEIVNAVVRVVALYDAWEKPEMAVDWRRRLGQTAGK